jgi:shikimate kinase/3-dehydroquinate synthase
MRSVVLSGPMASGKTTVGRALAAKLELPFVDTDELLVAKTGLPSVADIWTRDGEAAFRAREADIAREIFSDDKPRVIAFGGGTVTRKDVRRLALEKAIVVTLRARPETTVARAGNIVSRPNLSVGGDPAARAAALLEERAAAYAECHGAFDTDEQSVADLADEIAALVARDPIVVPLGTRTYVIDLVNDDPRALTLALAELGPSAVVTVTDSNVARHRRDAHRAALSPLAIPEHEVTLAPGEDQKTLVSVSAIWDAALGARVDRDVVVLAYGGGVVGDMAGFAAATLLRGVRFVQAPTTLLSMVDASVGGKTGFDHPTGKNLIGAFWQPRAVVIDLAHLKTLPPRQAISGFAEIVKIALTHDAALFARLEERADALLAGDEEALAEVIRAAVSRKAEIVAHDEREGGARAILNLGHTVGHALEAHGEYKRWLHGEAVAIGVVAELRAAQRLGLAPAAPVERVTRLLKRLHLATDTDAATIRRALPHARTDKKRAGAAISLPIAHEVGRASVARVPMTDLMRALES